MFNKNAYIQNTYACIVRQQMKNKRLLRLDVIFFLYKVTDFLTLYKYIKLLVYFRMSHDGSDIEIQLVQVSITMQFDERHRVLHVFLYVSVDSLEKKNPKSHKVNLRYGFINDFIWCINIIIIINHMHVLVRRVKSLLFNHLGGFKFSLPNPSPKSEYF